MPPQTLVSSDAVQPLAGKRIALLGKLGGFGRRDAESLLREHQAIPVEHEDPRVDMLVIGADELPIADEELVTAGHRAAVVEGRLEILSETELWERMGLVPPEGSVRQLYTPAMLADLLGVSIAVVRRWHRRGLIVPVREVHRLAYFDFQEVATARHLAKLLDAGATPASIEKQLSQLAAWVPGAERPLAQLSIIVEGRDILLRHGEGLIEPSGQRRIDFEAAERPVAAGDEPRLDVVSLAMHSNRRVGATDAPLAKADLICQAIDLEADGRFEDAVDIYRAILAMDGPDAEVNFQIADLLYRMGDLTAARERYYAALELDENYVEARANLGCVLAETGRGDLAVAAFEGALSRHVDYPDVHYHLARTLDDMDRTDEALVHWQSFLRLAPDSPWSEEARDRLGLLS